ncbi:hypothetical protein [Sporosarcina highlanderae]|uniref:BppU N-terminal domain-containing protein n=1 Tax=Sporosarcina highlanderae TaxID=3035916 RepID=A0ABT8JVB6_9BACL|nr:hypothetical protein [Sporosarcina highlanderae]MDN4609114.1 hypothetical protein [Sporosarcina highlanderae]
MRQYTIASDLVQAKAIQPVVYKQYDNGDKLGFEFYQDGEKIQLKDETVLAFFELADQTVIQKTCKIEDGIAIATLDANILSIASTVKVEFTIYKNGDRTTTTTLSITVQRSINKHEAIKASAQWDIVEQVLGDGPVVIQQARTATTETNKATAEALQVASENKTRFLNAVETVALRDSTYPNPKHGDTVRVTSTATMYRFVSGTGWVKTDEYNPTVINEITSQIDNTARQTQTLTHGTQVINADGNSPLKVEFYGNTLVNLLGTDGNPKNASVWTSVAGTSRTVDNTNFKYGTGSIKVTIPTGDTNGNIRKELTLDPTKHYILLGDVKNGNATSGARVRFYNGSTYKDVLENTSDTVNFRFTYVKISPSDIGEKNHIYLRVLGEENQYAYFGGVRFYEISKATYDKIGVSLTDADVEKMFPYVDSVQHVKNPVVSVEGQNLFNPVDFASKSTKSSNSYDVTYKLIPNTKYTVITNMPYPGTTANLYFGGGVSATNGVHDGQPRTFTTDSSGNIYLGIRHTTSSYDDFMSGKYWIMFTLGDKTKPYVPRNPSYLYAETTLAGNNDKKDILSFNESVGRWEKTKWFEQKTLDGSLTWAFTTDYTGFKRVHANILETNYTSAKGNVVKHDGKLLTNGNPTLIADEFMIGSNGNTYFYISITDTDSGWTESMTPSVDLIKSYFYGWFYRGDGTTHKWRPIGDTDDARITSTLPTAPAPTIAEGKISHYKLTYQLAKPVIEPVTVEGDLVVSGATQVEVGSGVIVREKANPKQRTDSGNLYYINIRDGALSTVPNGNQLSQKTNKIIAIYKNGVKDDYWTFSSDNSSNAYGGKFASIPPANYDPTAEYTVTYEVLDKHAFTTNITEAKATYAKNIRGALDDTVTRLSDVATDVSVMAKIQYEILVRMKAGGL